MSACRALCSRTTGFTGDYEMQTPGGEDFLPLKGTDHVEFYVGNARQAAYFYRAAFGMSLVAYAGPETGQRDRASYVVQQGKIRFVLTTPLRGGNRDRRARGPARRWRQVVALWVDDARRAWQETTSRGAISVAQPYVLADEHGDVVLVQHSHLRRYDSHVCRTQQLLGPFLARISRRRQTILSRVPPACCTSTTWSATWAGTRWTNGSQFYAKVMGFSLYQHFDDKDISTEYSALMSKVMANGNGYVKFPINEPAEGKKKSQIEEYLEFYQWTRRAAHRAGHQ